MDKKYVRGFAVCIGVEVEGHRAHVHFVKGGRGRGSRVKIWLDPVVEVGKNQKVQHHNKQAFLRYCRENRDDLKAEWDEYNAKG